MLANISHMPGVKIKWHLEEYSALKRKEILSHTTMWMNLEGIMLSEINQSQKAKYSMIRLV